MCSSRGAAAPSSTAEISTAGTTRTPWLLSGVDRLGYAGDRVVVGEGEQLDAGLGGARATTSAGGRIPSEQVECDCRSKRGGAWESLTGEPTPIDIEFCGGPSDGVLVDVSGSDAAHAARARGWGS